MNDDAGRRPAHLIFVGVDDPVDQLFRLSLREVGLAFPSLIWRDGGSLQGEGLEIIGESLRDASIDNSAASTSQMVERDADETGLRTEPLWPPGNPAGFVVERAPEIPGPGRLASL